MRHAAFAVLALLSAGALAAPAAAGTLDEIIAHGMVVTISDMDFDLAFTPDGKFTGMGGQMTGTWKVDGDKLCTTSNFDPNENCQAFPKDKKSGDTFEISNDLGTAKVHIK